MNFQWLIKRAFYSIFRRKISSIIIILTFILILSQFIVTSATLENKKRNNYIELQDNYEVELQISNILKSDPSNVIQSNIDQSIDSIIGFVHIGNRLMIMAELNIPENDLINNINILIYDSTNMNSVLEILKSRKFFDNFQTLDSSNGVMASSNLLNNSTRFELKISNSENQTIILLNATHSFDYNLKTSQKIAQLTNEESSFLGQNDGIILISRINYQLLLENAIGLTIQNEMFFYDIFLNRQDYSSLSTVDDIIDQLTVTTNQLYLVNSVYFSNQGLINSVLLNEINKQINDYIIAETILIIIVSPSLIFAGILLYFFSKIEEKNISKEILYWKYKGFKERDIKLSIQLTSIITILLSIAMFFSGLFIFTLSSKKYDFSTLISLKILFQLVVSCSLLTIMTLWLNNLIIRNSLYNSNNKNTDNKNIPYNEPNTTLTNLILLDLFLSFLVGSYYASSEISDGDLNFILRFFLFQGLVFVKLSGIGLSVIIILMFFKFVTNNFEIIIRIASYITSLFGIKYRYLILRKMRQDKPFLKLLLVFVFVGFFLISIPVGLETSINDYLETNENMVSTSDYVISINGINATQLGHLPLFQEYEEIKNYYEATFFTGQADWSWLGGQTKLLTLIELDAMNYAKFFANKGKSEDLQSKIKNLDGKSNESIVSWSMVQTGVTKGNDFVVNTELDSTNDGIENIIFNAKNTIDYIIPGLGNRQVSENNGYLLVGNDYFFNNWEMFKTFSTFSTHNIYINFKQNINVTNILDRIVNDIIESTEFEIEILPLQPNKTISIYSGESASSSLPTTLHNKYQGDNLGPVETYLISSELLSVVIPSFILVFILFMNIYTYYSVELNENNIKYLLVKGYNRSFVVIQFWLEQVVFILIGFLASILGIHIFVSTISYHSLSFVRPVVNWDNNFSSIWIDILIRNIQLMFILATNMLILSFLLIRNFRTKIGSFMRIQFVKR